MNEEEGGLVGVPHLEDFWADMGKGAAFCRCLWPGSFIPNLGWLPQPDFPDLLEYFEAGKGKFDQHLVTASVP